MNANSSFGQPPRPTANDLSMMPFNEDSARIMGTSNKKIDREIHQCQWFNCGRFFESASDLFQHMSNQHVGRKTTETLCLTCGWNGCGRRFDKRDHIISHVRVHVPSYKPYNCDLCSKCFSRSQDMKKHRKTHKADPPSLLGHVNLHDFDQKTPFAIPQKSFYNFAQNYPENLTELRPSPVSTAMPFNHDFVGLSISSPNSGKRSLDETQMNHMSMKSKFYQGNDDIQWIFGQLYGNSMNSPVEGGRTKKLKSQPDLSIDTMAWVESSGYQMAKSAIPNLHYPNRFPENQSLPSQSFTDSHNSQKGATPNLSLSLSFDIPEALNVINDYTRTPLTTPVSTSSSSLSFGSQISQVAFQSNQPIEELEEPSDGPSNVRHIINEDIFTNLSRGSAEDANAPTNYVSSAQNKELVDRKISSNDSLLNGLQKGDEEMLCDFLDLCDAPEFDYPENNQFEENISTTFSGNSRHEAIKKLLMGTKVSQYLRSKDTQISFDSPARPIRKTRASLTLDHHSQMFDPETEQKVLTPLRDSHRLLSDPETTLRVIETDQLDHLENHHSIVRKIDENEHEIIELVELENFNSEITRTPYSKHKLENVKGLKQILHQIENAWNHGNKLMK